MSPEDVAEYLVAERQAAASDIEQRRALQLRYFTLYLLILSALLTYAGFGAEHVAAKEADVRRWFGFLGLILTAIAFMANVAFTTFLGYSYRGIVLAKKNIAGMRLAVSEAAKSQGMTINPFSDFEKPDDVYIGGGNWSLPYWFVALNWGVCVGSLYFLNFLSDFWRAFEIFLAWTSIAIIFYPKVCANFYRYLYVAYRCKPGHPEIREREAYARTHRQDKIKRGAKTLKKIYTIDLILLWAVFVMILFSSRQVFSPLTIVMSGLWVIGLILRIAMLNIDIRLEITRENVLKRLYR